MTPGPPNSDFILLTTSPQGVCCGCHGTVQTGTAMSQVLWARSVPVSYCCVTTIPKLSGLK